MLTNSTIFSIADTFFYLSSKPKYCRTLTRSIYDASPFQIRITRTKHQTTNHTLHRAWNISYFSYSLLSISLIFLKNIFFIYIVILKENIYSTFKVYGRILFGFPPLFSCLICIIMRIVYYVWPIIM